MCDFVGRSERFMCDFADDQSASISDSVAWGSFELHWSVSLLGGARWSFVRWMCGVERSGGDELRASR